MKLKDVKKVGFYRLKRDDLYLLEVFENTDPEYPDDLLWVDTWYSEGLDSDGRETFAVNGKLLTPVSHDFADEEVIRENKKYTIYGQSGAYLIEDKLTYKEKLDKVIKLCYNEVTKGELEEEKVKFAKKLLKILEG